MTNNTQIQFRCNDKLKEDFARVCKMQDLTISQVLTQTMKDIVDCEPDIVESLNAPKPTKKESKIDTPPKQVKPRKEAANGSYDLKDNESFVRLEGDLIVYKDEFGVFRRKKTPN